MLICPLLAAFAVRRFAPRLHAWFTSFRDLAFYLWAIALSLAIAVTVRSIVHTDHAATELVGIAFISLFCCILQFGVGKRLGRRYGLPVSTTQSLGQKNTVFAIWLGYTFFNPVTSMAGGFYSIWHNLYNTWQMRAYNCKAGKGGA
ncbi:sodium-dependent transporter [gut metagenome]|uniref:Sodium-dependent transporter n=1 Tax=gut metagenome TaxID=749906 RepID=J9GKC5_9ZZZZ